jgi:hypothetical protein
VTIPDGGSSESHFLNIDEPENDVFMIAEIMEDVIFKGNLGLRNGAKPRNYVKSENKRFNNCGNLNQNQGQTKDFEDDIGNQSDCG